jgi:protocatechuate 3,4-dioxygenase, beta subunit
MKAAPESARAVSQREITVQIARIAADHHGKEGTQPRLNYPPYRSSLLRHPRSPFVCVNPDEVECWAKCFGRRDVDPLDPTSRPAIPASPSGSASS